VQSSVIHSVHNPKSSYGSAERAPIAFDFLGKSLWPIGELIFWNWLCAVQHQHHADGHASTVRDLLPPLRALRSLPAIPGFAVSTWVCRAVLLVTSASALAANGPT
jgi:hypothetical protein